MLTVCRQFFILFVLLLLQAKAFATHAIELPFPRCQYDELLKPIVKPMRSYAIQKQSVIQEDRLDQLIEIAGVELGRFLTSRHDQAKWRQQAELAGLFFPEGLLTAKARMIPKDTPTTRRMTVWVDTFVEERFFRTIPLVFSVEVLGTVTMVTKGR